MESSQTTLPVFKDLDRPLPWWGHVLLGLPAVLGGIGYGLQGKPLPSEMLAPLQEIVKQQRRRQKLAALKQGGYLPGIDETLLEDFDMPELLQVAQLQQKQPRPVTEFPSLVSTLIGPEPPLTPPVFPETPLTPEEGLVPMYAPPDPARQAWERARAGLSGLRLSPEQASEKLLTQRFEEVKEGRAERKRRAETLSRAKLELLKGKALTAEQQQAVRMARTEDEVLAAIPPGQMVSVNVGGIPLLLEGRDAVRALLGQERGQPEVIKLQDALGRLPAGDPRRKALEARLERLTREPREPGAMTPQAALKRISHVRATIAKLNQPLSSIDALIIAVKPELAGLLGRTDPEAKAAAIAALEEEEAFLRQYVPAPTGGRRPGTRPAPQPGPTAFPPPVMPGGAKTADEFLRKFGE